ncbi:fimbria/pilus outer membrane usher protein [Salmonella enterica subsp. enterica serovar Kentucky]|nr:fimbria/pilus outer membrane usher protein [Salmonella enterica subsp. enterica serovar Kentucky]
MISIHRRQRRFDCEVKESDGSINRYNVPYSAVPILQREGRLKYAATVAEYRSDSSQKEKVKFSQATLIWGYRMVLRCMAEHNFPVIITRWRSAAAQIWATGARCRWMSPSYQYAGG